MDKNTPSYNLNVVLRETGIKPDTLRAWERRYGLPVPDRTDGGHRLYSTQDIEIIKWLMERLGEGMRISRAVKLWEELNVSGIDPLSPVDKRVNRAPIFEGLSDISALVNLRESWLDACLAFNEDAAEQILTQAFARYPVELVVTEVMQSGMAEVGDGWFRGEATVQQEHFISALTTRRLNALLSAAPAPTRQERIVVGTPPDEQHVFAPLMISLFLRYQGWPVTYLGSNVPLNDLQTTIEKVGANLVIFTANLLYTASSLLLIGKELKKHDVRLAFGGRVFSDTPELHKRVPGYYLGNDLRSVTAAVREVLAGNLLPNDIYETGQEYRAALQAYGEVLLTFKTNLIARVSNFAYDRQHWEMVTATFTDDIRAGLIFGDLSFVDHELDWVANLMERRGGRSDLLDSYLKIAKEELAKLIGRDGKIILDWLDGLIY